MASGFGGRGVRDRPAAAVRRSAGGVGARPRRRHQGVRSLLPHPEGRVSLGRVGEQDYERRLAAAYPIHPELFDRLYGEWSTLDKFQRTRGVLRLMAAVVHELWERSDANLLIMPATVPIDAPQVSSELTRYLEDGWTPVIESDIDGPNALPLRLDRENPESGAVLGNAPRGRTIYLGSAPTQQAANRGIDDRSVKLGCVQPGETPATFGDALRRLTDQATYLYVDGQRYWFSLQPSVTRLAQDRAASHFTDDDVDEEIRRRLADSHPSRPARRLRYRPPCTANTRRSSGRGRGAPRRAGS